MPELLHPKEIKVTDQEGAEKTYIISKFPAVDGREIVTQYPTTALPKIGDYNVNKAVMLKLMCFVAVPGKEEPLRLTTQALIDNHVPDWETLGKIEMEMLQYNCSFLRAGKLSTSLEGVFQKALALITKTLTDSSVQLSPTVRPPSTTSEPSTP